jgi:hypothetical protein
MRREWEQMVLGVLRPPTHQVDRPSKFGGHGRAQRLRYERDSKPASSVTRSSCLARRRQGRDRRAIVHQQPHYVYHLQQIYRRLELLIRCGADPVRS